ncbi:hypothetical protein QFC19_009006 [Naganishia cerealis]|uniref:Uncharacterized protein n=1 Tax=Naganishia cerealis TaxID=610337 RepID=A0ACC2UYE7_9TREE|nr:hypothetical protein QFC19_009006 [Naganishia cerealis]
MAGPFFSVPLQPVQEFRQASSAKSSNTAYMQVEGGLQLSARGQPFSPSPSRADVNRNALDFPRRSAMPALFMPPSFPSFKINLASNYSSNSICRIDSRRKESTVAYDVYSGLKQLQPRSLPAAPLDEFEKRGGVLLFDPSRESNYAGGHGVVRDWLDATGLYNFFINFRPPHQRLTIWRVPSSFTPSQLFLQPAFGRTAFVPEAEEDGMIGDLIAASDERRLKRVAVYRTNDTVQGHKGIELRFNPAILEVPRPKLPNRDLMVRIWLSRIVPEDVYTKEFRGLAGMLANLRIRLDVWIDARFDNNAAANSRKKVAHPRPFQSSCHVSALTAIALIMRTYKDVEAFIFVLSLAPVLIATDFRLYRMGQAIGTSTTRAALSCIFSEMASLDFMPDQVHLMSTATDLIICHLGRHDHPRVIGRGQSELVTFKLIRLINIKPIQGLDDRVFYAKMAAIRDGVIYGAIRCYAQEVDRHTEGTLSVITAMLNATVSLSSAAGFLLAPPFGGLISPIATGIGNLVSMPIKILIWERWSNGEVDRAIAARFELVVVGLANRGFISGWEEPYTDEDGTIPSEYAEMAKLVMEAMMSRMRPSALTWLLK